MSRDMLPGSCPSCGGEMEVVRLRCAGCETEVQGRYPSCPFCRLDPPDRLLLERFLDARGNLKEVQRALGVSYPTARQRVDELLRKLGRGGAPAEPGEVLRRLRSGEIGVEEAERLLRGRGAGCEE